VLERIYDLPRYGVKIIMAYPNVKIRRKIQLILA
jgi:hypothetical protein